MTDSPWRWSDARFLLVLVLVLPAAMLMHMVRDSASVFW